MIRIAAVTTLISLGLSTAAVAAGPVPPQADTASPPRATQVVEVYVGGYYGGYPRYYRPYPWRPWYYGGPAVYYDPPPPAAVAIQPPPQPIWTGTGVIWLFPGAPQ